MLSSPACSPGARPCSSSASPLHLAVALAAALSLAGAGCESDPFPVGSSGTDGGLTKVGQACNTGADCTGGAVTVLCCAGRCVDTATDPRNCGACATACSNAPQAASAVCEAGTCRIGLCAPGFANCDKQDANGCETDLQTDNANCGRCGGACLSGPHGVAMCAGARCVTSCDPPFSDCDNNSATGCEIDVANDPRNCASCGNACPTPANATASCAAGRCGIAACNPGFDNCDGNPGNGCETPTTEDLANCGGCGKVCGSTNATPRCTLGLCALRCNAGFGDCDNDPGNGCEASLGTDNKNCGTCGKACANGQSCRAGVCGQVLYNPVGPQTNVPAANLVGWAQCFSSAFNGATTIAQLQAMCPKANLLVGCRKTGSATLSLLAWAPRADVFSVHNMPLCANAFLPHQANGTGWYFDSTMSWGFAKGGDTVQLCSCDTGAGNGDQRLCWHVSGGSFSSGYRCGSQLAIFDATWERVVYQAD